MSNHAVLTMIFFVVFLGWLIIWIIQPMKVYGETWYEKLATKLNSSYFGEQGVNILFFSFPMMLIAVLSCVYLHFQKKIGQGTSTSESIDMKKNRLGFLRSPVLVMNPLGIVTASELAFATMFFVLLTWSLANYLIYCFAYVDEVPQKAGLVKTYYAAVTLGYLGNICWAFLFFPVTRGSSILPLVGLTSESAIKYHIWLGHLSMILFFTHTIGFIFYWAMTNQMSEMLEWSKTGISNVAGEIAIVFALVMWVTSFPRVRRKTFELFFYTHHLYPLYIIFYVLHVGVSFFCMILPGIFLFLIDRYLRFLQSRQRSKLISARLLPCGYIEMNFSKNSGLEYNPTSILFINVASISKLQWHPFTITSSSNMEPDNLSIVIKTEGSWSQKLYKQIHSTMDHLEVSTEGPYGPISSTFMRHEKLIMVSGGSGITPFFSIIRDIISQSQKPNNKVPQLLLVCSFKNYADLSVLDLLLPISSTTTQISDINLQIEAYITREKEQPITKTQQILQAKWFKPNSLDTPITAVLGPNSCLWLAAIISSSFVMFLLLLGIVTRFYIYPIVRHNPDAYHFSYRALWDMFLVCICVLIASSVAFFGSKRQNTPEEKQPQNIELPKPTKLCVDDRELESLPFQYIHQASNIHFGSRPDLKKILLECEGSDVGVLVCGPRKMRHEVANICSLGSAEKLHFESISFNW